MNIVKAYDYLFYKLYMWSVKVNGDDNYHKSYVSIMISIPPILNIITALILLELLGVSMAIELPNPSEWISVMIFLLLWLTNYTYFSYDSRYMRIINSYKHESKRESTTGSLIVAFYVAGSFVLLIMLAVIGKN